MVSLVTLKGFACSGDNGDYKLKKLQVRVNDSSDNESAGIAVQNSMKSWKNSMDYYNSGATYHMNIKYMRS